VVFSAARLQPLVMTMRSLVMSSLRKVLRALFGPLTARGWSFLAAGGAAVLGGLAIPEPDLVRVGGLLVVLPVVSALIAGRLRYRLACTRRLDPPRVPAGQPTTVTVRVGNVSRVRTGVLLAEDATPDPLEELGSRLRFVLDEIEPGGHRELSYQIRSDTRGKFPVGPLRVRVAGPFGLVEASKSLGATSTLVVTPKIVPLPGAAAPSSWFGQGDGGMRTISAVGADDAAPRTYQDGDSLHRVHWKSTARHGQLMVRREEHQWRNSASVFLDTRRSAHAGRGAASSFEFAVSAAASIGAHLSGEGFAGRLVTEAGEIATRGTFSDTLLDMLAVITPSRDASLGAGTSALASAGGQLIAVAGRLSADDAAQLASARRGNAPAMALLLAVSAWESGGTCPDAARAAEILSAAGWRVVVVTAGMPLPSAWQQLHPRLGPLGHLRPLDRADRLLQAG
jgi:uncharacterized protein (DUF58 family)